MKKILFVFAALIIAIGFVGADKTEVLAPFDYGKITGGGVMSSADKCGVNVSKTGWQYDSIISGSWQKAVNTSMLHNGYIQNVGMSLQNTEIEYRFCCEEDSFVLVVLGNTGGDRGVSKISIDGDSVGTKDWYNLFGGENIKVELKILIPTSGEHTLRFKMATKNGGSSDYNMQLIAWWLRKGSIGSP